VNIVGPVISLYHWEGAVERDEEYVVLMKTTASHQGALIARLEALHPYEVPEVLVLPVDAGSQAYLSWITTSVQ
jgi:periplasmic divalent cation tolerance protein